MYLSARLTRQCAAGSDLRVELLRRFGLPDVVLSPDSQCGGRRDAKFDSCARASKYDYFDRAVSKEFRHRHVGIAQIRGDDTNGFGRPAAKYEHRASCRNMGATTGVQPGHVATGLVRGDVVLAAELCQQPCGVALSQSQQCAVGQVLVTAGLSERLDVAPASTRGSNAVFASSLLRGFHSLYGQPLALANGLDVRAHIGQCFTLLQEDVAKLC